MNAKFPGWMPAEVKEWFGRWKRPYGPDARIYRLATDPRMRGAWEWFEAGRPHNTRAVPKIEGDSLVAMLEEEIPCPTGFLVTLDHAAYFPGKPSDMPPKQRAAYLEKVRKHAEALMELLADTQFDRHIFHHGATSIDPDKLEEKVLSDFRSAVSFSRSEMGGIMLAYETGDDGEVYKHGAFFPDSALVNTLSDLVEWTKLDDHHDLLFSAKPVKQSGIRGRKSAYLAKLYVSLKRENLDMPYTHYASAANVALDLDADEELDEDSARTQINRMLKRGDIVEPQQTVVDGDGSCPF